MSEAFDGEISIWFNFDIQDQQDYTEAVSKTRTEKVRSLLEAFGMSVAEIKETTENLSYEKLRYTKKLIYKVRISPQSGSSVPE